MTARNFIHYYAEPVKDGYSIVRQDVVIDGELVSELSHTTGSPGPTATVEDYLHRNYGTTGKVVL